MRIGIVVLTIIASLAANVVAEARNTPCSGRKGGVKACTADGKYLCRNGSVSQSKQTCHKN